MPPKKQSIGRSTAKARKSKALRSLETKEEQAVRNEKNRLRTAHSRLLETDEKRAIRYETNRLRTAQARSSERNNKRKAKADSNREYIAQPRSLKTILEWIGTKQNRLRSSSSKTVLKTNIQKETNRLRTAQLENEKAKQLIARDGHKHSIIKLE